jgi:2-hydroxy-6-oxonona-2,4-dienedioate hydrolase/2-succinyl-6-hydroxy-2,4-cyclohexadiene-1-carboxylate synthase
MPKAFINGISVHYQVRGAGPDLVLVHGITSCIAQWYVEILPALARHHRVTMYDLRGHGLTDVTPSGYTSDALAGDLLALMDHIGIASACIVGHSYGGAVALHAALLRPERVDSVVLLDTGLACLRHLRVIGEWSGWKTHGADLARFGITLERFLETDRNQDVTAFIRQSLSIPLQTGFRKGQNALTPRLQRLLDETAIGSEFREVAGLTEGRLVEIAAPVLAIYGGTSPYEKMAEHLSRLLPHCRYELLPNSGHFYAADEPALVVERILPFLADPVGSVAHSGVDPVSRV